MRIVLLGAGLQGQAIAHDIARNPDLKELIIADADQKRAQRLASRLRKKCVQARGVDVTRKQQLHKLLRGADCTIGATTYHHNLELSKACIAAGSHFCDLGGNNDIVRKQHRLNGQAKKAEVTLIPDCGLAPGMVNILGYHWAQQFDHLSCLQLRVGGLPQEGKTTLAYQRVFSIEGLINEYIEDCDILVQGKKQKVPGLRGVESLGFGAPYDDLEAFYTSGGTSTLPRTLKGHVENLDYKTIRYAGHVRFIRFLQELGFFESELVTVGKRSIVPRALTAQLLENYLPTNQPDVVLIRVTLEGRIGAQTLRRTYDCVDHYDPQAKLTAMQRTTGFSVAIVAQELASGRVKRRGTVPQEKAIDGQPYLEALGQRNIRFSLEEIAV